MKALLVVIRLVLFVLSVVLLVPLHILGSALSRILIRKRTALTLRIEFASRQAFITAKYGTGEEEGPNLLTAYILYLSQYFYACDNRQVLPVANCLAEHVGNRNSDSQLTGALLEAVRGTLSTIEARAFADEFRYPFDPPITYTEGVAPGRYEARYSLVTFRRGSKWSCDLRSSLWMNLILFPITVGLLYTTNLKHCEDFHKAITRQWR